MLAKPNSMVLFVALESVSANKLWDNKLDLVSRSEFGLTALDRVQKDWGR